MLGNGFQPVIVFIGVFRFGRRQQLDTGPQGPILIQKRALIYLLRVIEAVRVIAGKDRFDKIQILLDITDIQRAGDQGT